MADVLIIDDGDRYAELVRRDIAEHRYRGPARHWRQAASILGRARGRIDLILLDVHFDIRADDLLGFSEGLSDGEIEALKRRQGLEILARLRQRYPDLPVVLMTSRDDLPLGEAAERLEAEDYTYLLDDDWVDAASLRSLIANALDVRRGADADGPVFWGRPVSLRRIRQRLGILARGRLPVVLLGPTGTGKSLIARHVVHARSQRTGHFVAVDLSTLPADLMAAHLFGSVKGAYTGSVGDRVGAFEAAHNGTLFLDEVGNLSLDAQKMLLTVLQDGIVTRLGDLRERTVDVKLVVATNEDLAARVRDGTFRADLFMRLNPAACVTLPPLRERGHDPVRLLRFMVGRSLRHPYLQELLEDHRSRHDIAGSDVRVHIGGGAPERRPGTLHLIFPERTLRLLQAHDWPGNLREYAMTIENALLFAVAEMADTGGRADAVQVRPRLVRDLLGAAVALRDPVSDLPQSVAAPAGPGWPVTVRVTPHRTLNKVAQDCERQFYTQLYLQERGNFGGMARVLLGREEDARKVQLRFNQLGLKVRELKGQL